MQVGTGKSVLNGIAIGKLKIYKKKDTAISTAPVADTAAELERFEAARQKAIEQQTALYEKALAEAGEDIAEVFNIHAMMLDDDDFVDARRCAPSTPSRPPATIRLRCSLPWTTRICRPAAPMCWTLRRPCWTFCRGWTTLPCRAPSPAFW